MRRIQLKTTIGAFFLCQRTRARSWREIVPLHDTELPDHQGQVFLAEPDALVTHTSAPTMKPITLTPTRGPTLYVETTAYPSYPLPLQTAPPLASVPMPMDLTPAPTNAPSTAASVSPTNLYPPVNPPLDPDPWFFNYDTRRSSKYGPGYPSLQDINGSPIMGYNNNAWGQVEKQPYSYWEEFTDNGFGPWQGVLQNRDILRNMCGRVGMQSPVDIRPSGGAVCREHHEIRTRPGDFRLRTPSIMKQILPTKLRLLYQRRNCADLSDPHCAQPDPPKGDFPSGWGGFADVLHVDFKVPSEHMLNGERFDGEMQIVHLNPQVQRLAIQVALIKATNSGFNYYFEQALQAFEEQYQADQAECLQGLQRERNLNSHGNYNLTDEYYMNASNYTTDEQKSGRRMQNSPSIGVWDPHHEMLVPSIYFWRYDGSLTEPPCGEFVTWFISDKVMKISKDQLRRMKHVLFTHIDQKCEPTSVQFDESVARPVQATAGRPVWHCTQDDFAADTGIITS
ncbi:hypothetical protein MPSEU_000489500 [Mayamaea pseudoterrestris]|nr:hypothetical protein MPSEU_000489500 [Mayamaea pseudoterrestris]